MYLLTVFHGFVQKKSLSSDEAFSRCIDQNNLNCSEGKRNSATTLSRMKSNENVFRGI